MVTMVTQSCVTSGTIWGACLYSPHKCLLQFHKQLPDVMPWSYFTSFGGSDAGAENSQPAWKWLLVILYNGTRYSGWQMQPDSVTVQEKLVDALTKSTRLSREELKVVAAGRTDVGVHACGQVAHFTTPTCFDDLEPLQTSLNGILPPDIRIREVASVQPEFHDRYRKTYQYPAHVSPVIDLLQCNFAYHIRNTVNVAAMQEAASYFVGLHNLPAFANHSTDASFRGDFREILRDRSSCSK